MALHGKSEMVQLKAIGVLDKMQGYNSPDSVQPNHVHVMVDAAVIDQLTAGYAQLGAREARFALRWGPRQYAPALRATIRSDPKT